MVGAIIGAAAQVGSSIYGAVKSSQAAKKAQDRLSGMINDNRKWYEEKMAEDYTKRADVQNILRKQRDLLSEQYQRARATNVVAGGTDESLALQQQAANEAMGETMADIAAQSTEYKQGIENQYRTQDAALQQQMVGVEQNKAQAIANAAGQIGSAVSGLTQGASKIGSKSLTPAGVQAYADAQELINKTTEEDLAKVEDEITKIEA